MKYKIPRYLYANIGDEEKKIDLKESTKKLADEIKSNKRVVKGGFFPKFNNVNDPEEICNKYLIHSFFIKDIYLENEDDDFLILVSENVKLAEYKEKYKDLTFGYRFLIRDIEEEPGYEIIIVTVDLIGLWERYTEIELEFDTEFEKRSAIETLKHEIPYTLIFPEDIERKDYDVHLKVRDDKVYMVIDKVYASVSIRENNFVIDKISRPRVTIEENDRIKTVSGFKLYMKKVEE